MHFEELKICFQKLIFIFQALLKFFCSEILLDFLKLNQIRCLPNQDPVSKIPSFLYYLLFVIFKVIQVPNFNAHLFYVG